MTKILITGGAGFIGSHLVDNLLQEGAQKIIVIDNLSTGNSENLPKTKRVEFIKEDITKEDIFKTLFKTNSFDYIFHLAAVASVQASIENPVKTHKINCDATLALLEKCVGTSLKRFIFPSSAAVYGNKPNRFCKETDPINPMSPYGIDKFTSEQYAIQYHNIQKVPVTVFRLFNIYGPRQNPSSPYSGVISLFCKALKEASPRVNIFGDGHQTRDFVYVQDAVQVMLKAIQSPITNGKIYNLGKGKSNSLNQLLEILEKISGKTVHKTYLAKREGDIHHSCADISQLKSTGLIDRFKDLKTGLSNYLTASAH